MKCRPCTVYPSLELSAWSGAWAKDVGVSAMVTGLS